LFDRPLPFFATTEQLRHGRETLRKHRLCLLDAAAPQFQFAIASLAQLKKSNSSEVKFNHFLAGFTHQPDLFAKISRRGHRSPYKTPVYLVLVRKFCVELYHLRSITRNKKYRFVVRTSVRIKFPGIAFITTNQFCGS
jgi:hypothetical protein